MSRYKDSERPVGIPENWSPTTSPNGVPRSKPNQPAKPVKFVLMNTAGNSNRDLNESISLGLRMVVGLVLLLLSPHVDNEKAADHLREVVGQNNKFISWAVVRPYNLQDESSVTLYELHESPIRSAIFDPGKTCRIRLNDSGFMPI